ncbi:MAG: UDP-2,4-diacetamido-2,4,6-trideoxy-beta-L-altropyranose hydrolase, partial [Gammaproteobacteria bacterium]
MIRCLVLAECLRQRGFRIGFVCRAHHNHRNHLVTERGFRLHQLETSDSSVERTASSSSTWLDVTWEVDAWQTIEACKAYGHLYGLIVDHYGLDYRWEKMLRPYMNRIMVIDDLADRNHDCDVLLDQNLYDDMESRYSGHVPGECKLLLGPAFALLHPDYRRLHKTILPRTSIKRILVFFGAVDPQDLTSMA